MSSKGGSSWNPTTRKPDENVSLTTLTKHSFTLARLAIAKGEIFGVDRHP